MPKPRRPGGHSLLIALASGVAIGALVFGARPAYADWPVIDVVVDGAIKALQDAATSAINAVQSAVTGMNKDISQLLKDGFTQQSNYAKAQIGAQQQIADASNTSMAWFQRQVRDRQIVDEHTASPVQCAALDAAQSVVVASGQSWKVSTAIEGVSDPRGEAYPNTPAYYGSAQAVQAINQLHLSRYCAPAEDQAGLCSTSPTPNADQRASSLFGNGTYDGQDGINTANDYITNLIQPIVPAAQRGDQLTSVTGQDASARRREYNARMSLAHSVLDYVAAAQSPSVSLNAQQQQQLQYEGLPAVATGSWLEALSLDVERRYSGLDWAAQLQAMPPTSVEREVALELAVSNYLMLQTYKVGLMNASINATHLAEDTEKSFPGAAQMPTPSMAAN